ncbi:basement membrane-specific heparan sulfate proteoglycan core protein-like isoform X7 [Odontomachus brunneus]|uniref:basement membrane-specific heparan sulfate proteoglycan core protein-like isoform X7 n=1 Tax=Odontomachus brunneus TaxID=486640 RepID=UPI0013F1A867|nr:basement membrane-specific heparan sulfate proteoglycan core protein-like isoform X7 [Odontomachus brunneus]
MKNRVLLKSALLLLLIAANGLVTASEDDDLIFDPDGKQLPAQAPLIETQQDQSFFHRIKRGFWNFFEPQSSSTTTTTTQTPPDQEQTVHQDQNLNQDQEQNIDDSVFVNTQDGNRTVSQVKASSVENGVIERLTLNNGNDDDNDEDNEHNNEVEDVAESRRIPVTYGNSDDEDLAGSGDIEGSASETDQDNRVNTDNHRTVGPARFYRVTLTVGEPYRREYSDRNSPEYRILSSNLTKALENLYNNHIPNYNYFANVVKISPTSDAFTSQVTLDIGSTFTDEHKVRDVLEQQLEQYHSLGNIQVGPEGFTFRIFQAGEKDTQPECDQSAELMCKSGACVPLESRCDGVLQCDDGSDEDNCPGDVKTIEDTTSDLPTEMPDDIKGDDEGEDEDSIHESTLRPTVSKCRADDTVRCADGSRYICSVQECDGIPDCDDGGDEVDCPHPGCGAGEFACDVNRCILEQQRCNFVEDCQDGSDEHDCHYPACSSTQFLCKNGQCIDRNKYCNGVLDCHDGTDEHNCHCRDDQFECAPGFCVPLSRRCDGFADCNGGRDEQNCPNMTQCRADEFECDDGSCVSKNARCDGRNDCHDHSDEYNCNVTTCSGDQYRCLDGICLSIDKRCNGVPDCRNGEDENQCGCGEAEFRCTDGRCIGYELQCNGVNECSDGSDERDCVTYSRRNFHNAGKFAARMSSAATFRGGEKPAEDNTSRPSATTESVHRLTIIPSVTISDSILEMFPEEARPRVIPSSVLRNPTPYLTRIAPEREDDGKRDSSLRSEPQHAGRELDAKTRHGNVTIYRPSVGRGESEALSPERPKLSDDLVKSMIQWKHNNDSAKNGRADRRTDSARKVKTASALGKFTASGLNVTIESSSVQGDLMRNEDIRGRGDAQSGKNNGAYEVNAMKTRSRKTRKRKRKPKVSASQESANRKNEMTKRKPDRKYGKYMNEYLRKSMIATGTTTELAVDARTSSTAASVVAGKINRTLEAWQVEGQNTRETINPDAPTHSKQRALSRETYVTKGNKLDSEEDFFGYRTRKNSRLWYYKKKYLRIHGVAIETTSAAVASGNEVEGYNLANNPTDANHDRARELIPSVPGETTVAGIAKVHKDDYPFIKTESLLYESSSPDVKLHRYFPETSRTSETTNDIDRARMDLPIPGDNSISSNQSARNDGADEKREQSQAVAEKLAEDNDNPTSGDDKIDSGLLNSDETTESMTARDFAHTMPCEFQGSRETLEEDSKHDFGVLLDCTTMTTTMTSPTTTTTTTMTTTTKVSGILVTRANEDESTEKPSAEKHNKCKHKDHHNDHQNNRCKKRKKNCNGKNKRCKKRTTVAPEASITMTTRTTTSVDYSLDYSTETASSRDKWSYGKVDVDSDMSTSDKNDEITTESFKTRLWSVDKPVTAYFARGGNQSRPQSDVDLSNSGATTPTTPNEKCVKRRTATITEAAFSKGVPLSDNEDSTEDCAENTSSTDGPAEDDESQTTGYQAAAIDGDDSSASDSVSTPRASSVKTNQTNDEQEYSTRTVNEHRSSDERENATDEPLVQSQGGDGNSKESSEWNQEDSTQPTMGATVHPYWDSEETDDEEEEEEEEKEDTTGASTFNGDVNVATLVPEDYEADNCDENQHACDKYTCIDEDKLCDGIVDCLSANDEIGCDYIYMKRWQEHLRGSGGSTTFQPPTHPPRNTSTEEYSSFEYPRNSGCVNALNFCDGKRDCADGSDEEFCMNVVSEDPTSNPRWRPPRRRECDPKKEMRCDDGACVLLRRRCDNIFDCFDGSDERGCGVCTPAEWKCASGECLPENYRCDGITHCADGSDEDGCVTECPAGWFRCNDGLCLDNKRRCDGRPHCLDGSDEINCPRNECPENQLPCGNGVCINKKFFCDHNIDCHDATDERDCPDINEGVDTKQCPHDSFTCNDGSCISQSAVCDGHADCPHDEDESTCRRGCTRDQFQCANGDCINADQRCNGYIECADGSDEPEECESPPGTGHCAASQFMCISDRSCVPHSSVCNGIPECTDGSDEENCDHRLRCTDEEWRCKSGDCVPRHQRCDRRIDCPDDDSDELDCDYRALQRNHSRCRSHEWQCNDGHCIPAHQRCDRKLDCPRDMSDEIGCSYEKRPTDGGSDLRLKTYPSEQVIKENPAKQGREVVFQCRDEGLLRARVRWIRANGLPLPSGSRDINGRLEIPNIQLDHAGTYICEAVGYSPSTPGSQVSVSLEVEKFEQPATRPPQVCQYDEATCSNGDCIPKSYVCDGKFDCTDGSDEMRCSPHGCEPNEFRCNNKQCVSKLWHCDGDKDCADGSDEENCAPSPPGSACRYNEFACSSNKQCIPKSYHCDMERDCLDGSDELGCSPVYIVKPPPPMVVLEPGDMLILTCTAIGVPTPEINWRLNWGHIPSKCTTTSVNGTGTLTCPDIRPENQGAYSCEALNVAGFVFAVPDAIVVVKEPGNICPKGKFNSEAKSPEECISCFCFGVATECRSADLFTYHIPPPFDRYKIVSVETTPTIRIHGDISNQISQIRPLGRDGVQLLEAFSNDLNAYNVPYFALPESYHGSQLKSYGGYLKYSIRHSGNGTPNSAPNVIVSGNNYILMHKSRESTPNFETEESVRFFYGEWYKQEGRTESLASREEIMMTLANVDNILLKVKYDDSPQIDVRLTNIIMDTADVRNTGLGSASYVEECQCPSGYTGLSCEQCAPGYLRRENGPWLGQCYRDEPPCPPGYYGDPSRNIPCQICPCPLTNPSNQFARTCHLGSDGQPTCDCPAGYVGRRCEQCASGYQGNPLIPGDMCVAAQQCDPNGSLSPNADLHTGRCHCKEYATGLTCNQCKANTFNLASTNQFGCIACFCMGITNRCISSNWYRNEIRVSFTNSIRDFSLIESKSTDAPPIIDGIHLDTISREIIYNGFPNRGNNDVYYWQLPSIFLGDQITSYGGNLKYTVRYVPSPGGQSSRNNAADVELISANDINLLYYSRESPEPNSQQSFTVPLLEQYWQRNDGTQADREHLLMALADVRAIRIKATYTTHTDEAALSFVSLDTAEKYNTGKERAVEVEECTCPAGYRGLSCEDCDVGYTRAIEGLYLGICEPCNCNGHSNQCDPETGICENCAHHTTGDSCEVCEPGYEGDAIRGTPNDCTSETPGPRCRCNADGSRSTACVDGRCECKRNVEGPECNRCRPSTYGLRAENIDGCIECYCSGVTDQCHESTLYIQQIPMWVYDSHHGFTLTDSTRRDVVADGFELNVAMNEIGYRYPDSRSRRLFWSLPSVFTGNKVKSYGGNLTLTQHITAYPEAKSYKDQDILLIGNGITLFWTNPTEIQPDIPMTYTVPLKENEWRRLTTEGPRSASRTDLMIVLSNLEAILVRASHSDRMTATYISDISMDTAVETLTGNRRATQVEACRCPLGYIGSSCETCARGYYRDTSDRSVSYLGSCNLCPCNKNEESCEISRSGQVKCHCLPGYTGLYCQDIGELMVSLMPMNGAVRTYSTIQFKCNYDYPDTFYIYFKLSSLDGLPVTTWGDKPGPIIKTTKGAFRTWSVHVNSTACNVECHIVNYRGKELIKIVTSITPVGETTTTTPGPIPPARIMVYVQEPEFQIVHTGNTVRYHCTGRSQDSDSVRIRWEKEGGQLPPGRSVDDANGLLVIRDVKVSDSGIYVCQVSDGINIAIKKVTLTVGGANPVEPRAVISPTYQQVREGKPVEFRCEATGNPPPQLDWVRVHGAMSPEATFYNGIWNLPAASKSDAAEYKCIARNNVGIDEKTTVLYVEDNPDKPPPQIIPPTVTPSEWSGTSGDAVRLICTPSQRANVTWTRSSGLPLPNSASQRDGVLTITNPSPSDSGIYVCTSTDVRGTETSTTAKIVIVPRREPPTIKVKPERQVVSQGTVAEVRCITSGEPGIYVKWSKYTETMSSRVQQVDDTLRIVNAQVSDRGVYICRVSSPTGSYEASAIIEVAPREAPILELYPQDVQTVILGGSADLQCRAKAGFPVPELHWSRQDYRSFASNIEQLPGGLLRLSNITANDGGAYICSASNEVGSTSIIAHIEVQSMPVITITPKHGILQVKRGGQIRLVCSASGHPQPNVAWSKHVNGMTVYDTYSRKAATPLSAVYEIFSVSPNDEGSYTCQATNAVGIAEERIQIRIEDDNDVDEPCTGDRGDIPCPPDDSQPHHPIDRGSNQGVLIPEDYLKIPNGGKVEMRCQVFGPDGDHIYLDWKRSDHRSLPQGSTVHNGVLSIPTVDRTAAGEYICLGLDPAGTVLFRAKSHLEIISPPRIDLNPTHQTVGPGENPSIVCTATGDEPLHIEWEAIGRPLPYSVTHHNGILQFHGIAYSDAGKYVCKATNGAGTAEAVAEVSVNEHSYNDTRIHAEHRDVTTYAGSSVRLRCDVRERATIHWSREGQALPITARIGEDYLELMQVKPEDSGRYICQAQTSRGVSSDYINFNVSLVNLLADCMPVYRSQCRHWEYECRSLQCIPMEYFCDGYVQCNDGTDERFCRNLRYRQFLQRRRAAASPLVSVEVSQDPINIGDTVDIHCTCIGTRNPRYHWSRPNHARLPPNAQIYGNVLRLTNIAVDDSGLYRCTVDTPEGVLEKDLNLIVHGGNNDEPAIETKFAPYGSSLEMDCRIDLDPPIQFHWNKLGGLLPRDTQTLENKLKLTNVKAEDAGTYICVANNGHMNIEVPTVLVVTGVVPNFSQAPESYIALPPLPDSYLKFNIEISFKPESNEGILLYNDESSSENGDFIVLSLINGYPQFKFNLGSGAAVVRADRPVTLSEWHTIKIQRNRKEGTMVVDGEGPYKVVAIGRRQGLDLKEPLYVGGIPSYNRINKDVEINSGFVGCISRLILGEKQVDLIGNQTDSVGITNCETCAENPCNNGGVCQETSTKNGYTCLCRAGFSGKHCDNVGQSCYPGACGEGKCVDKETGFDCYCSLGKTGPRCQHSVNVYDPAFHDEKAFIAHETPKALRRLKVAMSFNPTDTGDGILMYCSQSDEGLGDFAALVIKDQHVEFRFDIGSGEAVIRSPYTVQPGVWTYVMVNRDFKEAKLSVNSEPFVEGKAPGASRTMTLNTPLYIGGVDRSRIVVNKGAGVDRNFRGCISELEISSNSVDILRSATDLANIEDCSMSHSNQTIVHATVTTLTSTQPPTTSYNPCASNPCIHGVCQSSNAYDYSCTCEYGYVGRNCENVLKQCELLTPCRNGGTCTNLHGSYKCDCRLGYNGQNCEKLAEITYDVAFRGDGWLELDRSVMTHEEERSEVLGFEISTNRSNGLIMWHGQTPNDLTPDDYIAVAVVDGYVEYQYNLGSGPAVIRVTAQRVDDGERHRIILKRQGSDGSIELNGEHTESGVSDGLQQILNTRGSVYLGGVPDYAMTYGRYHDGFSGCIYTLEVQDSGAIDIGEKAVRGINVSPCTSDRTDRLPTRGDLRGY